MKKVIIGIFILSPLAAYGIVFTEGISNDHSRWAEFGTYIGGIYGALGFLGLIYSMHNTRSQFVTQSQENTFFNLWGALQSKVSSAAVKSGKNKLQGQSAIEFIVAKIKSELEVEAVKLARNLLCQDPEKIGFVHYANLQIALNKESPTEDIFKGREEFIRDMKARKEYNERSEYLKYLLGASGQEKESIRTALRGLGSVNFYKVPFETRRYHYQMALSQIKKTYGAVIDGYFRNVSYLAEYALRSINAKQHIEYLGSQLSRYELVLIFYCLIGSEVDQKFAAGLVNSGVLSELLHFDCRELIIDMPTDELLTEEIRHVQNIG